MLGTGQLGTFELGTGEESEGSFGFGQAQAFILKSAGYAQAQATIKITTRGHGQAQAKINSFNYPQSGQAQALIYGIYIRQYVSQATTTPTLPEAPLPGSVMVFWVNARNTVPSMPGGWTGHFSGLTTQRGLMGYKVAGPSETTTPVTVSGAGRTTLIEIVNASLPLRYESTNSGLTSPTAFDAGTLYPKSGQDILIIGGASIGTGDNQGHNAAATAGYTLIFGGYFSGTANPLHWAVYRPVRNTSGSYFVNGTQTDTGGGVFFGADAVAFTILGGTAEYRGFGQAQAYSLGITKVFGQAQAHIKQTYQGYGQAQALIINQFVWGQAQAYIKTTISSPAQAQARIKQIYQVYAQANAWIIPPTVVGQAQARIIGFDIPRSGQAQADIVVTSMASGNAMAHIHKSAGHGLALASIKTSRNWARGQARALIGGRKGYGQAQAFISKSKGVGQAQAWIKITSAGYGQAQARILQTRYFQAGQAQAQIKQEYQSYGQAQAQITVTWRMGQAQADIKQVYNSVGQALARIKQTYQPVGQAQGIIKVRHYVHGQAQARIKVQYNATGQAQAFIGHFQTGQAQARILAFNYPRHAQAQGYILASNEITPPGGPTSEAHTYLVRYNNYDLPGYAQEESYDSVENMGQHSAFKIDSSLSQYLGLQNKDLVLRMRVWEPTYYQVKEKAQKAATMLRSIKGWARLFIQQPDAYFLALVKSVEMQKSVGESTQVVDYVAHFEAKPWLISKATYEISGTGLIDTGNRTIYDGGWTPTRILVSGTDVEITAYTETGDPAGSIVIDGICTDLIIDSDNFTATENGINRNDLILTKDYAIYVGPGKTFFQINGATSCVIQYNNRWYLSSTRGTSAQTVATTPFPVTNTYSGTGQARAAISSPIVQGHGQAAALINAPLRKVYGQAQAYITSPIKNGFGQARAFLRSGRTWTTGQAQARIKVIGNEGVGQARAFIEGNTKYKSGQAKALIRQHKQIGTGLARAKIITVPAAPSSFTATPGDEEVTLTWS